MMHPVFGIVERISPRPCSKTAAAGSQSKPAGTSSLLRQHTRRNVRAGAATAGRNFASVCWNYSYYTLLAIGIIALAVYCVGVGYIISKNLQRTYIHWVETSVVSKNLHQSEIDWVEAGVVSQVVRKQIKCGSCWAMAVVESVQALHYLNTKQPITLSVQELIDCDKKNNGCKGGWPHVALEYIMENGISTEISYPDMSGSSTQGCNLTKTASTARISDFRLVEPTEDALEEAVAKQPVIVNLQYEDGFRRYKRGIMDYGTLPPTLRDGSAVRTHSVLIVGYGTTNGVKYWRFKNSWGKTWGEGGFGKLRRRSSHRQGVLGMFKDSAKAVYPVLNM